MSRIISKRYPVVNGDIDRAWLVDQLPRAKRPNALLSVALSPFPIRRIAALTWVTPDALIDFVLGEDDLTPLELLYLCRAVEIDEETTSPEWMTRETLHVVDDDECIETMLDTLPRMPEDHPSAPLIWRLCKGDNIPFVAAWGPVVLTQAVETGLLSGPFDKPRTKRLTRRRRKTA